MAFVYILRSTKNKRYYIGSTIDFKERFKKHQKGQVNSTRIFRPYKLMFVQEYDSIAKAKKTEYKLKRLKRKDYIDKIVHDGVIKMES